MPTNLLIIDDMADFRQLVRALLEAEIPGLCMDELEGAGQAEQIQSIVEKQYDLILLDYQLEGHDGLSVQRNLREAGCTSPIILLTAYGDEKLAVRAIKEGAFDYLSKTQLDQDNLVNSVRGALQSRIEKSKAHALFGDNIQVKGYRPVRLLGRGTYSMVYLAENELTGKQVVLKLLIVSNVSQTDIARFMREYEIMANLSHENIGIIHDQSVTEDIVFMLMEHLDGGTLKDRLNDRGRYPEKEAFSLMITLFEALHYIHERGILHRDIKPANIVFRSTGVPVIVDFGIASRIDSEQTLTDSGSVVGTPSYMSPEQALGESISARSDLYSMGVVFYEMLTGVKPISGDAPHQTMYRVVHDNPRRLPPEFMHLQDIFDVLLAKNPEHRFTSGKEIADVLRHVHQS
jgi:serine/threonine protein kinase